MSEISVKNNMRESVCFTLIGVCYCQGLSCERFDIPLPTSFHWAKQLFKMYDFLLVV